MKFLYAIENMVESLRDIVFILFSYFDDIIKVFYTFFLSAVIFVFVSLLYIFSPVLTMVPISQYQLCDAHLSTISSFYQIVAPMNRFSLIPTSIHKFGSQILPGLRLAILQSILLVDIAGWYIG